MSSCWYRGMEDQSVRMSDKDCSQFWTARSLQKTEQETKMNNRIMNPSKTKREAFGLIAWLEQTKISLPLKGVECAFNVCGDVVSVEIDQIFHQNSSQPLDCLYTFPLPA